MAQYWIVGDSLDKVDVYSTAAFTTTLATVGGIPVIRSRSGGNSRAQLIAPKGIATSSVTEVTCYFKWNLSTTHAEKPGTCVRAGAFDALTTTGIHTRVLPTQVAVRIHGALAGTAVDHSVSSILDFFWHSSSLNSAGTELKTWAWEGGINDAANRPASPLATRDVSGASGYFAGPALCGAIHVGRQTGGSTEMDLAILSVGTDGDPAPTGPVDVSAEPFRLRHHPRLHKVIPTLTFPTVTDIGANCVRPRVTKGY